MNELTTVEQLNNKNQQAINLLYEDTIALRERAASINNILDELKRILNLAAGSNKEINRLNSTILKIGDTLSGGGQ